MTTSREIFALFSKGQSILEKARIIGSFLKRVTLKTHRNCITTEKEDARAVDSHPDGMEIAGHRQRGCKGIVFALTSGRVLGKVRPHRKRPSNESA
jgi:hypothetical protein